MTLLWTRKVGGLQILHPKMNSRIDIDPLPGANVINLGDMMQLWTRGMNRSTIHRLANMRGTERSIALFNEEGWIIGCRGLLWVKERRTKRGLRLSNIRNDDINSQ